MATLKPVKGQAGINRQQARVDTSVLQNDPVFMDAWNRAKQLSNTGNLSSISSPEAKAAREAYKARAAELGVTLPHDYEIDMDQSGNPEVDRAGFVDRNADWLGALISGAAAGGPLLAAGLGGGAGTSLAVNPTGTVPSSLTGGGAAAGGGSTIDKLLASQKETGLDKALKIGGLGAGVAGALLGGGEESSGVDPDIRDYIFGQLKNELGKHQERSMNPVQLRSSYVQGGSAPIDVPGVPFKIGEGMGQDPALLDPTLLTSTRKKALR